MVGDNDEADDYALMGGVTAAFSGILAGMGLRNDSKDSSTISEESNGIVSRRMTLLANGDDVVPLDDGVAPKFIEIPKRTETEVLPLEEGVEVDGPYRPSSQYAV